MGPKMTIDRPKIHPRPVKIAQDRHQSADKIPQDGTERPSRPAKPLQEAAKKPQEAAKKPQELPKTPQDAPRGR